MDQEKFRQLESEKEHLFHGSGFKINAFASSQTIYASPHSDYAIFMALINEVNCPDGYMSSVKIQDGHLVFSATQKTLDQLTADSKGYVYVFDKTDFQQKDEIEWCSVLGPVSRQVIEVSRKHFLPAIHLKS